jgi:radical SAM protein with 4Fe4S-binding SPASM domain
MTWATFETIVDQIRAHTNGERFALSFSGMGEPLLNPLIFRFIAHVSPSAFTSFASNGAALTERNVAKLIEAGLDAVFFSFNSDDADGFAAMMGGLSYDRVLANLRTALRMADGTRLKIRANVSITKANQDRVTRIGDLLRAEGVEGPVTYSLCHSRGGNLRDSAVCDTPPMPVQRWTCDVMQNTLFVDWQGVAMICDHDLHREHVLGDLMTDGLEIILARRRRFIEEGAQPEICRNCNDVMRVGGATPLASGAGGNFRDWIYELYRDVDESLSEGTPPFRWIYAIAEKNGRVDRLLNRLLAIEKSLQADRARLEAENAHFRENLARSRAEVAQLGAALAAVHGSRAVRAISTVRRLGGRVRTALGGSSTPVASR